MRSTTASQRRVAVFLRNRAAGRQLGVAEHLALDIAGQPELQLADILLDTEAADEGLLDRLLERAFDGIRRGGRFRADLVADRSERLPVAAEVALERAVDAAARLVDLLAVDRLAEVAEGVDRGLVARPSRKRR